jgi:hypothetical protein
MANKRELRVQLGDKLLPEAEAREIWDRFSLFMDNCGTLESFATQEGVASVKPAMKDGVPTLLVKPREMSQ